MPSAGKSPSVSNSGTVLKAASRAKSDSSQDRRGQSNPNRQRQPVRKGAADSQLQTARVAGSIKGTDLGAG
jgi:hypothetical protein